jgi:6-phosphogluconolactonase
VRHGLREYPDSDALAKAAAAYVAELARNVVEISGTFSFAVSGGHTPWAMFEELSRSDVPWKNVVIYQVDERVAPPGDPERNLTRLLKSLAGVSALIKPMPVDEADLDAAAKRYAAELPEHLDLVHLGLGPDGHTASLVPADPMLDVADSLVALTAPYAGLRRMTLTYRALARAHQLLWLVSGDDVKRPLSLLVAGDVSITAGRVQAEHSLIMADRSALGS